MTADLASASPRNTQSNSLHEVPVMHEEYSRRQTFPLRLSPTMRQQANQLAHQDGISLNHFISLAIAEKISRMEQSLWAKEQEKSKQDNRAFHAPHLPAAIHN